MICSVCGGHTVVIDSRADKIVARRRKCTSCFRIFYTTETEAVDSSDLQRVVHDKKIKKLAACYSSENSNKK